MVKMIKRIFCKIGWHSFPVGYNAISSNRVGEHAQCKWCEFKGMVDSQGNLF